MSKNKKGFKEASFRKPTKLGIAALAICLTAVGGFSAACAENANNANSGNSSNNPQEQVLDASVYYAESFNGGENSFSIIGNGFMLIVDGERKTGTYTFDGENITLVFSDASTGTAKLTVQGIEVTVGEDTYAFLEKVEYTVSYNVDGGTAVSAVKVVNGKTAEKPADPTKEGYNFIGWYKDAEFTTPYNFDAEVVTADTTVYARFIKAVVGQNEYTVTFNVDGDTAKYEAMGTVDGVLYDLPTPSKADATFVGWWMSDTENAEELTAQYKGQALTENKTLYAVWETEEPNVSVNAGEIAWTGKGINKSYSVKVTAPDGTVETESTGETVLTYNFAEKGKYTVEVTVDGKTGKATFVNKALDTVSLMKVVDGSVLVWKAVENAEKYVVQFKCGDELHTHTKFDNGTSTYFNFANCSVPAEGIEFTVTAQAHGYVESVSEKYVYTRNLDKVENVTVDGDNDEVVWDSVENATSYVVKVVADNKTVTVNVGDVNSYSLKYFTGEITVQVTPVAYGYNAVASEAVVYNKSKLAAPTGVTFNGQTISWDENSAASSYVVKINGVEYPADSNSLTFPAEAYKADTTVYNVSVQAVQEEGGNASAFSDAIQVNTASVGELKYEKGKVVWNYVADATYYGVRVNGESEVKISATTNMREVALTKAGENVIEVRHYDKYNSPATTYQSIKVYAYEVRFDTEMEVGKATQYKAVGDPVDFGELEQEGHEFLGWYNVRGGAVYGGKKWTSEVFDESGNVTLYAYWRTNMYEVELDCGDVDSSVDSTTVEFRYGDKFEIAPPVPKNETYTFIGWYTKANGQGERLTDENGVGVAPWRVNTDKIYAAWTNNVFKFTSINNGTAYAVEKGADISLFETVTIPATYEGKEVLKISAGAFEYCTRLKKLRIPDTLTDISLGEGGQQATGNAFRGCINLQAFEVYCAHIDGHDESELSAYESMDGMLVQNNPNDGGHKDIVYVPLANESLKQGTVVVPYGVTRIPANIFHSSSFTKIVIPSTLQVIGDRAFYNNNVLSEVVFEPTPEGETEVPLTMESMAFRACYGLKEITLPSRLASMDMNANSDTFYNCVALTKVHIDGEGGTFTSSDGLLLSENGTKLVYCPVNRDGVVTIPSTVKVIGAEVFAYANSQANRDLTSIVIPGSVERIEENAFKNSPIRSVTFEGTKDDAAMGYTLDIMESAFYGCANLETVTLPANLDELGEDAFGAISNLKTVVLDCGDNAVLNAKAFDNVTTLTIGVDVPYFDIATVFTASRLLNLTIVSENKSFSKDEYGLIYDYNKTQIAFYPANVEIDEYTVPNSLTTIGKNVFSGKGITTVNIGPNVTSIGENAFKNCTNLTTVNFTGTRTAEQTLTIGAGAFASTKLTSVALPEQLTVIGENAFSGTELTSLELPSTVTTIGAGAFAGSKMAYTSVTLNEGLTTVGEGAFTGAPLKTFHISSTVTDYGTLKGFETLETITVAANNANFSANGGVLYNKDQTIIILCPANCGGVDGVLTIPANVTEIAANTFQNNKQIKTLTFEARTTNIKIGADAFGGSVIETVVLPNGFTEIAEGMFKNCTSLTKVEIPTSVTKIKANAFVGCTNLATLDFKDIDAEVSDTVPGLEFDAEVASSGGSGGRPGGLVRPGQSTKSYGEMFTGCNSLTTFKFPARTTGISPNMFKGCTALTTVTNFPTCVTEIPKDIFNGCTSLSTFEFKDIDNSMITKVDSGAFANASLLTSIRLPDTVTTIAVNSFGTAGAFTGVPFETFYVPASITDLKTILQGITTLTSVVFAEGEACKLTTIPAEAFKGCTGLTSIRIPASVKTLGSTPSSSYPTDYKKNGAIFDGCSSLTSVTFEEGSHLETVQISAFGAGKGTAPAFTSITFPESVSENGISLGTAVFGGNTNLTSITLSASVKSMNDSFKSFDAEGVTITIDEGNEWFEIVNNCSIVTKEGVTPAQVVLNFGKVTVKEVDFTGRTQILNSAYANQTEIEKIIIPASVTYIGNYAFQGCTNLKEVVFEEGRTEPITIGSYAFSECTSLKEIKIPTLAADSSDAVTLNSYMFYKSTALEKVVLPEGITVIGGSAFRGTTALKTVQVQGEVLLGEVNKVTLPHSLVKINAYAFRDAGIESITMPDNLTTLFGKSVASETSQFNGCAQLKYVDLNNVTQIGYGAFANCTALTAIDLSNVTRMGRGAFQNTGLVEVVVPALPATDLNNGGSSATSMFAGCVNLKKVTLHESFSVIGQYMFDGCTALEEVVLGQGVNNIQFGAFRNSGLKKINLDNVTTLKTSAFDGCAALTNIGQLNNNIATIERYVFRGTSSLTSINVPTGLTAVQEGAFENSGITSFDFSNVQTIGAYAFKGTPLTVAELPKLETAHYYSENNKDKLVNGLGDGVFEDCVNLTKVVLPANLKAIGAAAFKGTTSLQTILLVDVSGNYIGMDGVATIPATVTAFATSTLDYADDTTVYDGHKKDKRSPAATFQGSGIAAVEFLGKMDTIGSSAFEGCTALARVTFTKGVSNTVYNTATAAFKGCVALTEFGIASNVTTLAADMFNGSGLTQVVIPGSVKSIAESTFANCANLTKFEVASDNADYKVGEDGGLYTVDDELVCALPTA